MHQQQPPPLTLKTTTTTTQFHGMTSTLIIKTNFKNHYLRHASLHLFLNVELHPILEHKIWCYPHTFHTNMTSIILKIPSFVHKMSVFFCCFCVYVSDCTCVRAFSKSHQQFKEEEVRFFSVSRLSFQLKEIHTQPSVGTKQQAIL